MVTDTYDFPTLIRRGCVGADKTAFRQIDENGHAMPFAPARREVFRVGLNHDARTASFDAPSIVETVNGKANEWVVAYPGCKRAERGKAVGMSARTVDRALHSNAGKVLEFRGVLEIGGNHKVREVREL